MPAAGLLKWSSEKEEVVFAEDIDILCSSCGHCQAICKSSAITIHGIDPKKFKKTPDNWNDCSTTIKNLIRSRRSIRKYKKEKIPVKIINELIDMTSYAPTASNAHLVDWIVYSDKNSLKKISELTVNWIKHKIAKKDDSLPEEYLNIFKECINGWNNGHDIILRDAPHFIIAHGPNTGSMRNIDGIIALDYFEVGAVSSALGTCWPGLFYHAVEDQYEPLMKLLALPDNHVCYGGMMLGYPKYEYHWIPERENPKIAYR